MLCLRKIASFPIEERAAGLIQIVFIFSKNRREKLLIRIRCYTVELDAK